MQMNEEEICRSFKEAKDHRKQVGILADLNCCSRDEIRRILMKNGIDPPRTGNRYTARKEETDSPSRIKIPNAVMMTLKDRINIINDQIKDSVDQIEYHRNRRLNLINEKKEIEKFLCIIEEGENEQEQSDDSDEI